MPQEERLARINELARKQRDSGLSLAEQAEQHALRQAYLETFRAGLRAQLEAQGFKRRDKRSPGSEVNVSIVYEGHEEDIEDTPQAPSGD